MLMALDAEDQEGVRSINIKRVCMPATSFYAVLIPVTCPPGIEGCAPLTLQAGQERQVCDF